LTPLFKLILYKTTFVVQVQLEGLTGPIQFDARGFRTDFSLDIIELKNEGLVKVVLVIEVIIILSKDIIYIDCLF